MHAMIEKHVKRDPTSQLALSLPETHVVDLNEIEEDDEKLEDVLLELKEKLDGRATLWVLKASESNRGMDVHLFAHQDIAEPSMLDTIRQSQCRVWLLQQCVDPPLLFRNRKFHMRVVVLAVGDLTVYVHENVAVIPAHSSFARNQDGVVDRFAFLTNHCVQHSHADYEAGKFALLGDLCTDFEQHSGLPSGCQSAADLEATLFGRIKRIMGDVFTATRSSPTSFFPLVNCFELFGCDFLLDSDLNVFLLEINSDPSMTLYEGEHLQPKLVQILDDTLKITVDRPAGPGDSSSLGPLATPPRYRWEEWWARNASVSSVYVGGVPFLHAPTQPQSSNTHTHAPPAPRQTVAPDRSEGGAEDRANDHDTGDVIGGFHCVHRRAPRYEGMGGLKVFRGLLRTTLAMKQTCEGGARRGRDEDAPETRREGSQLTGSVAKYLWYAEEESAALEEALPGVQLRGGGEGVGGWVVQIGAYRDVAWEEVLSRGVVVNHYMARKALLSRVSLSLCLAEGGGAGAGPVTLRVGAENEREGWRGEVCRMMEEGGTGWRVEGMGTGSGTKQVQVCRTPSEVAAALGLRGGESKRSWTIQQWVPPVGGLRCTVELPVLATGKLVVHTFSGPVVQVETDGAVSEQGETVSLVTAAEMLGAAAGAEAEGWAREWEVAMDRAVTQASVGATMRRSEMMCLPNCFELFAFTFRLGPASLRLPSMTPSEPLASTAPNPVGSFSAHVPVRPWLLRVRPAMELDKVLGPAGGETVKLALKTAFGFVQWPAGVRAPQAGVPMAEGGPGFKCVLDTRDKPTA